jgi:hypothetical protein
LASTTLNLPSKKKYQVGIHLRERWRRTDRTSIAELHPRWKISPEFAVKQSRNKGRELRGPESPPGWLLLSGRREEQVLMDRFYDVGAQTAVSCAITIQNTITKQQSDTRILNCSETSRLEIYKTFKGGPPAGVVKKQMDAVW